LVEGYWEFSGGVEVADFLDVIALQGTTVRFRGSLGLSHSMGGLRRSA